MHTMSVAAALRASLNLSTSQNFACVGEHACYVFLLTPLETRLAYRTALLRTGISSLIELIKI